MLHPGIFGSEEFQATSQPTTEDEGSTDDHFVLPGRFAGKICFANIKVERQLLVTVI